MTPELAERVRQELYGGDWEEFEGDLRARLSQPPRMEKLFVRIRRDLALISRLKGEPPCSKSSTSSP